MRKAIIIGASSGIGKELAKVLSQNGYAVGLTGRRVELLIALQNELSTESYVKAMDVSQTDEAIKQLTELIKDMNGVELVVISAGVGFINSEFEWEKEKTTLETNVLGFAAMANVAVKHFLERRAGHLVGISSIAALRGTADAPAYNASKAFVSNYLEGLQKKCVKLKLPIVVTDVKPGFVDTAMAQGEGLFWVAPPEKAAGQIYNAIKARRTHVYVTKRWRVVGLLLKLVPSYIYNKM
jgi:short-subunit dehydrogenase